MSPAPLLQSWSWGEVQARAGWSVDRLTLDTGRATVLTRGRGPLRWAYVPRGPVPPTTQALDELIGWARARRLARLRVEPEATSELAAPLAERGFKPVDPIQPRHTSVVPLAPEDEMLKAFEQRTRYAIKTAERRGVRVEVGADAAPLDRLSRASASRQGIRLPGRDYYQTVLDHAGGARTFLARAGGEALAAAMTAHFGGRAYYLFAGWGGKHPELNPTYAALWAALKAAFSDGCRDIDLWGVPPGDDPSHPWYGIGLFKRGFNGRRVDYAGAFDLVLSPLAHGLAQAEERARRGVRRLRPS